MSGVEVPITFGHLSGPLPGLHLHGIQAGLGRWHSGWSLRTLDKLSTGFAC